MEKYSDILKKNNELIDNKKDFYNISLLSNTIVHQSKEIIECALREAGINAIITLQNYNNIVQDSQKQSSSDSVIIFWELVNLVNGLQYKIDLLTENEIKEIEEKIKSEIKFVFDNLKNCPLLIVNRFSGLFFSNYLFSNNKLEKLSNNLNSFINGIDQLNLKLIDVDKIIANVGIEVSFNSRYFYSSKAIYTVDFFKEYVQFVKPIFMSINGLSKKALIFDCDNTLWKGILGEDGFNGIELSTNTNNGQIFQEIQSIAKSLSQKGIIIGLCSKNNMLEVNEVIEKHPDMILKDKFISIKEINWSNKVSNLLSISERLNIGLDSIIFVDDSEFEINLIKKSTTKPLNKKN